LYINSTTHQTNVNNEENTSTAELSNPLNSNITDESNNNNNSNGNNGSSNNSNLEDTINFYLDDLD